MAYCEDCGTKLRSGICTNCFEELYINDYESEFLPEKVSDEFSKTVEEQRAVLKQRKQGN